MKKIILLFTFSLILQFLNAQIPINATTFLDAYPSINPALPNYSFLLRGDYQNIISIYHRNQWQNQHEGAPETFGINFNFSSKDKLYYWNIGLLRDKAGAFSNYQLSLKGSRNLIKPSDRKNSFLIGWGLNIGQRQLAYDEITFLKEPSSLPLDYMVNDLGASVEVGIFGHHNFDSFFDKLFGGVAFERRFLYQDGNQDQYRIGANLGLIFDVGEDHYVELTSAINFLSTNPINLSYHLRWHHYFIKGTRSTIGLGYANNSLQCELFLPVFVSQQTIQLGFKFDFVYLKKNYSNLLNPLNTTELRLAYYW